MNSEQLETLIARLCAFDIDVIGDLMLDVYLFGSATRISPEAPVPVVRIKQTQNSLGGAANVMRNISTLGAHAHAYGVCGKDFSGAALIEQLNRYSIAHDFVYELPDRPTTEKQRVIAGSQQVVRVDFESTEPVAPEVCQAFADEMIRRIENHQTQAVIIEDYAKGVVDPVQIQRVVDCAQQHKIITALDPNIASKLALKNLTVMTPNRTEAFALVGMPASDPVTPVESDRALYEVAHALQKRFACDYLLITLGAQGMLLYPYQGEPEVIPTFAQEVYDVSGAGDTVIAAFVLALLGGLSARDAAVFANHAAGVVVGKVGTVAIEANEVLESFKRRGEK